LDLLVRHDGLALPAVGRAELRLPRELRANAGAERFELALLLRQALGEHPTALGELVQPRGRGFDLAPPRQQPPDCKARELVLAGGEREVYVLVERAGLLLATCLCLSQALLLVVERLELGALAPEIDLRFADVLLEEQRAILERLDHAVGV